MVIAYEVRRPFFRSLLSRRPHIGPPMRLLITAALAMSVVLGAGASQAETAPQLELEGVTFVSSEGSRNELVLTALQARFDPSARVAHLFTVDARVAGGSDAPGFDITCDRGEYDLESGDFVAEGNVEGQTHDGRHFSTTRLRYHHEKALVTTDAPVVIDDAAGRFRGGGFRYHVREGRFRLLRGARVDTR